MSGLACLVQSAHLPYSAFLSFNFRLDQPSSSDGSHGVEPSHPVEEESRIQVAESTLDPGAPDLYQPENQMSESAPDTLHKSLLKSGTVAYEYYILIPRPCQGKEKASQLKGRAEDK